MSNYSFKDWILQEGKDIFGFDRELRPERKNPKDSHPIHSYDIEQITKFLAMHNLGELQPNVIFANEVRWGNETGAIRVLVNNWLNVLIERKTVDLSGRDRWVTKKVYQLNRDQYGGLESAISQEILQEAERIYKMQPDSAHKEYKDFVNTVITIANTIRRTAHDIFIFEGIKRINDNNYIIRMAVRGQGVQRKGQKRVEENQTQITFDPEVGLIRLTNYNIESPLNQHEWAIMQTDVDWYFAPTQSREEMSEAIATTLHWY